MLTYKMSLNGASLITAIFLENMMIIIYYLPSGIVGMSCYLTSLLNMLFTHNP